MLFMGDLENGVLGKENVAGDNGNESFKDEIDPPHRAWHSPYHICSARE